MWRTLRNPLSMTGVIIIGLLIAIAILAPLLAPRDPVKTNVPRA
jgi:hypothetical protein